jgi:hypothetical protein
MGDSENDAWIRALSGILGSPAQGSAVPSTSYGALASLGGSQPSPWAAFIASSLASTRPNHLIPPFPTSGMLSAANAAVPVSPPVASTAAKPQWIYVTRRFDRLIDTIGIRQDEVDDGTKKLGRLVASLNRCYWGESSETAHSLLLGSWAKQARVRPFSDIDVLFILPYDVYSRFENRDGNKQSQILQEVRANLKNSTYPRTEILGDRNVVIVEVEGVTIEVVPAFLLKDGRYWICDTKNNGRYKLADPAAELQALNAANTAYNNNARQLTRLLKKWQIQNDVAIKSFQLERLAIEFLGGWCNNTRDRFWYDWMMRDFFLFMTGRADSFVQMPGTGEWIALGSDWLGAAKVAYRNALIACNYEQSNLEMSAGRAWQEIFGSAAPVSVS